MWKVFLAGALGDPQRGFRVVHECVGIVAVVGVAGEAALHVHRNAATVDDERRAEYLGHLLVHPVHGLIFVAGRLEDETKSAAAEMRQ